MTGGQRETADGKSEAKIGRIIDAMRHERYRFSPPADLHRKRTGNEALGMSPGSSWSAK